MLNFTDLSVYDKEMIDPYLQIDGAVMANRCFACITIWKDRYHIKKCIYNDFLYVASFEGNHIIYCMPLGKGSLRKPIENIKRDAKEKGVNHSIILITKDRLSEVTELLGEQYEIMPERKDFDYIYDSKKLAELSGKKLHSKRNFINRFLNEYEGRWEYSEIDAKKDRVEISEFLREWYKHNLENKEDMLYEFGAINFALENYKALNIHGGTLRIDNQMVAFTLAAPQNDNVMDIMIEKADKNISGTYQMINKMFAQQVCTAYQYINREEDLGIEGLRKAKLSYHPLYLTEKYGAFIK